MPSQVSLLCDCCPCPFVLYISCVPSAIGARMSFVEGRVLSTLMPANIRYVKKNMLTSTPTGNLESPVCPLTKCMSLDWGSWNKDTMGIWNPLGVRPNPNPNPLTDGLTPIHTVTHSGDPVTQHSPGIHKRFTLTRVIPMTSETPVFTSIHKGEALAPEQTSQSLIPEHGIQVLQTGLPSLYVTWFKKAKY